MTAVFDPSSVWSTWNFQPLQTAPALIALGWYGLGLYATGIRAVSRARAAAFVAGVLIALGAVISPLHAAGDARFSIHMIQHQVLMLIAAPLIVLGRPGLVMALALPMRVRKWGWSFGRTRVVARVLRVLRNPFVVLLTFAGVLWIWHLPGPYDAAVRSSAAHAAEHVAFLGIAFAFWGGVLRTGPRRRINYVPSMILVIGAMMLTGWLAAVLTFGKIDYPIYVQRAALLHIDPMIDQELAGTLMWVPVTLLSFAVFAALFIRWFRELDATHPRRAPVVTEP
jgi:cytochrome c oxidase assembly factor CtaG